MDYIKHQVIVTATASEEMDEIYNYILNTLKSSQAASNLILQAENRVKYLQYSPSIYVQIEKYDELNRKYRRMPIKNYVLLYAIDVNKNIVYISHMYYGKRNYVKE